VNSVSAGSLISAFLHRAAHRYVTSSMLNTNFQRSLNVPGIKQTQVHKISSAPVSLKSRSIIKRFCFRKGSEFNRSSTDEADVLK
jgi:hypothetical protein